MSRSIALLGGGGHAGMLFQVFSELHSCREVCYVDPLPSSRRVFAAVDRIPSISEAVGYNVESFVNGIGVSIHLEKRFRESLEAESFGLEALNLVSSHAAVHVHPIDQTGLQILAGAVIQPGVKFGRHVVVSSGAVIEHDAELRDGVFVAPGAIVLGGAVVGRFAFIGAGAVILPAIEIGRGAVIGAGSVVTSDVRAGDTVFGVPGRGVSGRTSSA